MVSPIEDPFEPPFNQKVTGTIEPEEPDSGTKLGTKVPVYVSITSVELRLPDTLVPLVRAQVFVPDFLKSVLGKSLWWKQLNWDERPVSYCIALKSHLTMHPNKQSMNIMSGAFTYTTVWDMSIFYTPQY